MVEVTETTVVEVSPAANLSRLRRENRNAQHEEEWYIVVKLGAKSIGERYHGASRQDGSGKVATK